MRTNWDGQIHGRDFDISRYSGDYYQMLDEWASSVQYSQEAITFLELLQACTGEKVLDIGCGTGYLMELIERLFGSSVIGVDCGPGWHAPQRGTAYYGIAEALPFADSIFDVAILSHVLGHVQAVPPVLQETWRILKTGGRLGIVIPELACQQEWYGICQKQAMKFEVEPTILRYISKATLKKDLVDAGFQIVDQKEYGKLSPTGIFHELYAVIARKVARKE